MSVTGIPAGVFLEIAGPDGKMLAEIPSGIHWCHLTGAVWTRWETVPQIW